MILTLLLVHLAAADPIRIGAKADIESAILGQMCAKVLEKDGVPAVYRKDLNGGTTVLWHALEQGEIDVYPEYTGTLALDILHDDQLKTVEALRAALAPRGLALGDPLGFDDSYALGMLETRAAPLGIRSLSDLVKNPELRFALSHEFLDRADGFPGLKSRYALPQTAVTGLDHDLAYRALAGGTADVVDVYTTDPEIAYYGIRVLDDDRDFFPKYQALLVYRATLPAPAVASLQRLAGKISRQDMIRLNGLAKKDKQPEDVIASGFLKSALGISEASASQSRLTDIGQRTVEHLTLVGISLSLAVLFALPLGILAARKPRLGQVVLGGLGIIQTIPSLALLVFIMPLFGIGTVPAVVALFLYSMLPIVRNTATGLQDIPAALRESAEALGLSTGAQLWKVELPLATRSILAGIKTAAIINVGTATLGAIIGAGGYGQLIIIGIRRDDFPMILEGAVPAAVLALLVQGIFEVLERLLVPRGIRASS